MLRQLAAITKALQSLTLAGAASSTAIRTGFAGLAAFLGYELGQTLDSLTYKLLNLDLSGLNKPLENIDRLTKSLTKSNDELADRLAELGFTGKDPLGEIRKTALKPELSRLMRQPANRRTS